MAKDSSKIVDDDAEMERRFNAMEEKVNNSTSLLEKIAEKVLGGTPDPEPDDKEKKKKKENNPPREKSLFVRLGLVKESVE